MMSQRAHIFRNRLFEAPITGSACDLQESMSICFPTDHNAECIYVLHIISFIQNLRVQMYSTFQMCFNEYVEFITDVAHFGSQIGLNVRGWSQVAPCGFKYLHMSRVGFGSGQIWC